MLYSKNLLAILSLCVLLVNSTFAQQKKKFKPDINESKEFKGVFHSPSADKTPENFRSIFQLEIVVKKGKSEAQIQYANGTLVSKDGLLATVLDMPNTIDAKNGGIEEATVIQLNGTGSAAKLVAYDAKHGVALFRAEGLKAPVLRISTSSVVPNRKLNWCTVFKAGQKTCLYRRPLSVSKGKHSVGGTDDLCEVIDHASSSLTSERTGSPLIALDGSIVAFMGYQPHWTITGRNTPQARKVAWAVPGHVVAKLIEKSTGKP